MIALNSKQEITEERIHELGVISTQDIQNKAQAEKIMNEEKTISEKIMAQNFPIMKKDAKSQQDNFYFKICTHTLQ